MDHSVDSQHQSFPRQQARTQRFALGRPRSFAVSPDGRRVTFIRSAAGNDPVGRLWRLDVETGVETELVSPAALLDGDEDVPPEERARRERMREAAGGIVAYATDRQVHRAAFALSGRLFVTDLQTGESHELPARQPVVDPRIDPTGQRVAYCSAGALRVVGFDGSDDRSLVDSETLDVSWGLADFIAAEELDRSRGYWWAPEGEALIVERVDQTTVESWWVADPAHPSLKPVPYRYPAAGTPNAAVSLWLISLDGERREVGWDHEQWEYLASVHWSSRGRPLFQLLDRSQRRSAICAFDVSTGTTELLREIDNEHWVDVHSGVPSWNSDGSAVLTIECVDDRHALCENGAPVTPIGLQVRSIVDVGNDVLLLAQPHPTVQQVWAWDGTATIAVTTEAGVHLTARGGDTTVTVSTDLYAALPNTYYSGSNAALKSGVITSHAEPPLITPRVTILPGGDDDLRVAVLLPEGEHAAGALPVLLDPYGGPHAQRVLAAQGAFRESQWWADQGFAVVVVDGHGTPGTPSWERAIGKDLARIVLDDQVTGLHAAAHSFPQLDLTRVAIRGWSFGGYLSALAVLDRPDVFHAAVAGAPVTDWALYDTAYSERYLGRPQDEPDTYRSVSLLERAASLSRSLLLIHGLADDNVFVAHTLLLSQSLTNAGRPHTVLPLSGITHMASHEDVAANLLTMQVDFLQNALAG